MFVELIYDKRNFEGLPDAKALIHGELTKRIHRIFPDADIRVKPMMSLLSTLMQANTKKKGLVQLFKKCLKKQICGWLQSNPAWTTSSFQESESISLSLEKGCRNLQIPCPLLQSGERLIPVVAFSVSCRIRGWCCHCQNLSIQAKQ